MYVHTNDNYLFKCLTGCSVARNPGLKLILTGLAFVNSGQCCYLLKSILDYVLLNLTQKRNIEFKNFYS